MKNISWASIKSAIFTPKFTVRNVFLSLFVGIFLGYMTLGFVYGFSNASQIISDLFAADFSNTLKNGPTYLLNKVVVLGLAGLAVAVALKANLLNIGVSGQMTFGALTGYLILNSFNANQTTTFMIGILFAILGGAFVAVLTSILKVYFKVNEVVTAIMLNWAIVFLVKYFETNLTTSSINLNNPLYVFNDSSMVKYCIIGIILFVTVSITVWYVFSKTAVGFKITSSGESPSVAKYSGYKSNLNNIVIFAISGAIAGLAGFVYFYISSDRILTSLSPVSYGFTGIAVALVGMNNAIGIMGSALLFAIIDGPFSGLIFKGGYRTEVIQIFSAVITYFVAIASLWIFFRPVDIYKKFKIKVNRRKNDINIDDNKNVTKTVEAKKNKPTVKKVTKKQSSNSIKKGGK